MVNVILDVDGTIWDSAEMVARSWNEVLTRHADTKDRVLTKEDMYSVMGKTMTEIGEALFPELEESQRNDLMQECMMHENEYLKAHSGDFYEGIEDTLAALKASGTCRFYIVSNCQDGYIEAMLSHGSLHESIEDFECFGRTLKPKWDSIRILMDRCGLKEEETLYLGDTRMDEVAAGKAGIPFIHAAYGFGRATTPIGVLKDIRNLPDLLKRLF